MPLKLLTCYLDENIHEYTEMKIIDLPHQESKLGKILICFSIYTNIKKILSTKAEDDSISVIYGLRFISMIFIISFHTFFYSLDYMGK